MQEHEVWELVKVARPAAALNRQLRLFLHRNAQGRQRQWTRSSQKCSKRHFQDQLHGLPRQDQCSAVSFCKTTHACMAQQAWHRQPGKGRLCLRKITRLAVGNFQKPLDQKRRCSQYSLFWNSCHENWLYCHWKTHHPRCLKWRLFWHQALVFGKLLRCQRSGLYWFQFGKDQAKEEQGRNNSTLSMQRSLCLGLLGKYWIIEIIITFFMLGEVVDSYLTHEPFTIHWKLLAGILGTAGVLFLARMMKGVFVRQPIKAETHLWSVI